MWELIRLIDKCIDEGKIERGDLIRLMIALVQMHVQRFPDDDVYTEFRESRKRLSDSIPENLGKG